MDGQMSELKHIASIVRALINSHKPPCFLHDILEDYPEVEGAPLPYHSLGYETPEDLLTKTGEFVLSRNNNGDTVITAKFNEKSAHIAALVKGQRTKKPSRIVARKTITDIHRCCDDRNSNNSHFVNQNNGLPKTLHRSSTCATRVSFPPTSNKKAGLQYIASIVRSLINSRKPPCFLQNILEDYPLVGENILPYRSMGYKTPQELLLATGEFIFTNNSNGDTIITAKYNNKSAHIVAFVKQQKRTKKSQGSGVGIRNIRSPDHTTSDIREMLRSKSYSRPMQCSKSIGVATCKITPVWNQSKDMRDNLNISGQTQICPLNPECVHRYVHESRVNAVKTIVSEIGRIQTNRTKKKSTLPIHENQSQVSERKLNPIYRYL
uniref:HTH OST-type domain-containing protein n=1 Tax=Glossina brevipalpis TaxID=37001 RepID=A0A1A9W5G6_9MUSC